MSSCICVLINLVTCHCDISQGCSSTLSDTLRMQHPGFIHICGCQALQREIKALSIAPGELRAEGTEVSHREGVALPISCSGSSSGSTSRGRAPPLGVQKHRMHPKVPSCAKSETPPLPWLLFRLW